MTNRNRVGLTAAIVLAAALVGAPAVHSAGKTVSTESGRTSPEQSMAAVMEHFPGVIDTAAVATKVTQKALSVPGTAGTDLVVIPADVEAPITSQSEVSLRLPVPEEGSRSAVVDTSVVHTDLYTATDALVMPLSEAGLEIFYLMRNASAPSTFETYLDLPSGAFIESLSSQRLRVMDRDGATLLQIDAPWAYDKRGTEIPIALTHTGSTVTTTVDLPPKVSYPVLVDPSFTTHGDNAHRTTNTDGTIVASGHGWWKLGDCTCLDSDSLADVNIKLYNYWSGSWHMVEESTKRIKPGGGSSRRVNARDVCSSYSSYKWYSVVDVDIVGVIDSGETYRTPTVTLSCRA